MSQFVRSFCSTSEKLLVVFMKYLFHDCVQLFDVKVGLSHPVLSWHGEPPKSYSCEIHFL